MTDFTTDLLAIELQNLVAHAAETFDFCAAAYGPSLPASVKGTLNFTMLAAERASRLCSGEYRRRMALTGF